MTPKNIAISDFDYPLPDDRIAKFPQEEREKSKLLVLKQGEIRETLFSDLPSQLYPNSCLVFNNTKVIHARLHFAKPTGSIIEIFCLEPYGMSLVEAFAQKKECCWLCYVGNNKKWKEATLTAEYSIGGQIVQLSVERVERQADAWVVRFSWSGDVAFASILESVGQIPIPPYLHRQSVTSDKERYQTVYAKDEGSVAAPTAGLHFTASLLESLRSSSVPMIEVTLHVGAGTFKPVESETIGQHQMHHETVIVSREAIERLLSLIDTHRIVAVGTTSVRTLESLYWFGAQLQTDNNLSEMHVTQWEPYQSVVELSAKEALANILAWMQANNKSTLSGETQLMIAPGYRYRIVKDLITNFHQPKSTLLLLVQALIGDKWKECYSYALDHGFRFLSYGDSNLFTT